jgi:hypothetical protein
MQARAAIGRKDMVTLCLRNFRHSRPCDNIFCVPAWWQRTSHEAVHARLDFSAALMVVTGGPDLISRTGSPKGSSSEYGCSAVRHNAYDAAPSAWERGALD